MIDDPGPESLKLRDSGPGLPAPDPPWP